MRFDYRAYGMVLIIFSIFYYFRYFKFNKNKKNYIYKLYKLESFAKAIDIQNRVACMISFSLIISGTYFIVTNNDISDNTMVTTILAFLPYLSFYIPVVYIKLLRCK